MGQAPSAPDALEARFPCKYGMNCRQLGDAAHCQKYSHPSDDAASRVSGPTRERTPCRYGARCRDMDKAKHCEVYSHPGEKDADFLSQPTDQHVGTKFPRVACKHHPGCSRRTTCFYSHGLIHTDDSTQSSDSAPNTCFLGKAPHNRGCRNPTKSDDPYAFCSRSCRDRARRTPKGPLGCRRAECPCPCTVNGIGGQFCCAACKGGTPCRKPAHTTPTAHLKVVARPQGGGKYAPCAREGCACAGAGGSSWDGKPGSFCCRACRNGTPCTKLWHTVPLAVIQEQAAKKTHDKPSHKIQVGSVHPMQGATGFPDYRDLFKRAEEWAQSKGYCATRGPVAAVWPNESLTHTDCTARQGFERAVTRLGVTTWDAGEFGWHGTRSTTAITSICWNNWDPSRRCGQAYGPGEYFSRGTVDGLHYSEGYAGGNAANLLVVAWVLSAEIAGRPQSEENYAVAQKRTPRSSGHIVCRNPSDKSEMYCLPVAVVAFGTGGNMPQFCMDASEGAALATMPVDVCTVM